MLPSTTSQCLINIAVCALHVGNIYLSSKYTEVYNNDFKYSVHEYKHWVLYKLAFYKNNTELL